MKKALLVRLDRDLFDALAANRKRTGVPAAEYCRRALRLALFADIALLENRRPEFCLWLVLVCAATDDADGRAVGRVAAGQDPPATAST